MKTRLAKAHPAKTSKRSKQPAKKALPAGAKLISSKLAYTGRNFTVYKDTIVEPGGYRAVRDVIRHNGSVVVLAVDDAGRVLMVRQYRHAAGQFLLELPAGHIDAGEAPLAAAKRELMEETGYSARRWRPLVKYYASPGFLGETMQIYLAEGIREGTAHPEEDEKIEVQRVPLRELLAKIETGKIHDGKTVIGALLYAAKYSPA